jgi:hypothetical protein
MYKKALTIGINYKNTQYALNGCIADIVNISNILVSEYGYLKENIIQLRDDSSSPGLQPTKLNILLNLTKLVNESTNLSELWIHYSGHGSQIRDITGSEADGLDEVIVPVDFKNKGFIPDNDIFNIIKNVKCKTILIFDSCHSGTVCDLNWSFEFNGNGFIKTLNASKDINNPYIICLSGCKDSQTSQDSFSTNYNTPMGAFTDALIYCMKQNNFTINILKLYAEICIYLSAKKYSQKPILSSSSIVPSFFLKKEVANPPPPPPPSISYSKPPLVLQQNTQPTVVKPPSISSTTNSNILTNIKIPMVVSSSVVKIQNVPTKNGLPLPFTSSTVKRRIGGRFSLF